MSASTFPVQQSPTPPSAMSASAHSRSSSGSSQGSDESAKAEQRLEALQKQYEDFVCQNKCFHSDLQKEMLVALHTSNYKLMDVIYKLGKPAN